MRFTNLTPHTLNIHVSDDAVIEIEPSGQIARVSTTRVPAGNIPGTVIPTSRVEFGEVTDLPAPVEGTVLIVSGMVASATPREDLCSPGELVRDANGRPIGCRGLTRSC